MTTTRTGYRNTAPLPGDTHTRRTYSWECGIVVILMHREVYLLLLTREVYSRNTEWGVNSDRGHAADITQSSYQQQQFTKSLTRNIWGLQATLVKL